MDSGSDDDGRLGEFLNELDANQAEAGGDANQAEEEVKEQDANDDVDELQMEEDELEEQESADLRHAIQASEEADAQMWPDLGAAI